MVTTDPKTTFQENQDQTKAFRSIVDMPAFHEAVHKSIAEFVLKGKPTAEELEGVRRFLDVFLNIAEKPEPQERSPYMTSIATLNKPKPQNK